MAAIDRSMVLVLTLLPACNGGWLEIADPVYDGDEYLRVATLAMESALRIDEDDSREFALKEAAELLARVPSPLARRVWSRSIAFFYRGRSRRTALEVVKALMPLIVHVGGREAATFVGLYSGARAGEEHQPDQCRASA